ncbi:MAG TPA: type II toxin-antitoxin system VapC family toxin [Ktedonobacterales bacterium]
MSNDIVVVDTSIAVKWMVQEADTANALALLAGWVGNGIMRLTPSLLVYETANALYQHVRLGEIVLSGVSGAMDDLYVTVLVLDAASDRALSVRAVEIAHQLGLGPAYDTQFLALAEQQDCEYWTADLRFWTTAQSRFPQVRWLGELRAAGHP